MLSLRAPTMRVSLHPDMSPANLLGLPAKEFLKTKITPLWDPDYIYQGPASALNSVTWQTSLSHAKLLNAFQCRLSANPPLQRLPLASALLHHIQLCSKEGRCPWAPPTHFRALTSMTGAFSNLGKYSTNTDARINLKASATWKNSLEAWEKLSREHQPVHQSAATADEIQAAINLQQDPEIRAFLMLLWLLVGRKGDIANLHHDAVTMSPEGRVKAFIQEGKGVKVRKGKYHVVSHCPEPWRKELSDFLATPKPTRLLFRRTLATTGEILAAIRKANPVLNCRSTRRGAAQALMKDIEVTTETTMQMTGHLQKETLYRYLDWHRLDEHQHSRVEQAARRNLAPSLQQHVALPSPSPAQH